MSWLIDHAAFMAEFETMWDMINYNGYLASALTLIAGAGVVMIVKNMFSGTSDPTGGTKA